MSGLFLVLVLALIGVWVYAVYALSVSRQALQAWTNALAGRGELPAWMAEVRTCPFMPPFRRIPFREQLRWPVWMSRNARLLLRPHPDSSCDVLRRDLLAARKRYAVAMALFLVPIVLVLIFG